MPVATTRRWFRIDALMIDFSGLENVKVEENTDLKKISTFGIGGRVRRLITVASADDFAVVLERLRDGSEVFKVCAGGSNIVFPDDGLDCTLVRFLGGKIEVDDECITADAGVLLGDVIKEAIFLGLGGLETLSGIPGTVGGAVVGNAGAYGQSVSQALDGAEVLRMPNIKSRVLNASWLSNEECWFDYRESVFKKPDHVWDGSEPWFILRARFKFSRVDSADLKKISREIIATREKKYKPGLKCPGSFFKNVLVKDVSRESLELVDEKKIVDGKIPAGWLLEQVGARAMRVGGIYIADFHGNLFVSDGAGTARDVKKMANMLREKVQAKFGITLEEEVRYF